MGRLASMSLPVALIIICGQFSLRTDATFFIETHNNGIRLYECIAPRGSGSIQAPETSAALPRSYTTNLDIPCAEVVDTRRRQEIYSATNFYLVINPRLESGKRITLGSRSAELPLNVFVGVTLVPDEAVDYPDLSQDLDNDNLTRLRNKCLVTVPTRHLSSDLNFEAFVKYMATADFHGISHYNEPSSRRFARFNEIVVEVQNLYKAKISHGTRNRVSGREQKEVRNDVKSALVFLIQKLIDPCFVMSHVHTEHHIFMEGKFVRPMDVAGMLCKNYCRLLRTVTKLYSDAPACGHGLHDGACQNRGCRCQKTAKLFRCSSGPPYVTMIKCSNDIRTRLARSVNMGL